MPARSKPEVRVIGRYAPDMRRQAQLAYLLSLGDAGPQPATMAEASQRIDTLAWIPTLGKRLNTTTG